jgi:hypothetical protein
MTIGTWFQDRLDCVTNSANAVEGAVHGWLGPEEALLLDFFGPLMKQVEAEALRIGKQDLQVGLQILKDSALSAVKAAVLAPPGHKVEAAEVAFLGTAACEGVTAIHNAQAGALKAAVAIIQGQTANT